MSDTPADQPLVVVFHADVQELLPLAEGALQQEGIEYLVRPTGTTVPVGFGHPPAFGGAEGAADIFVNGGDAERARAILADLTAGSDAPVVAPATAPPPAAAPPSTEPRTCRLTLTDSGASVGEITGRQLQCLVDTLEEESSTDQDYYIDAATIDVIEEAGADADLVAILRRALGSREGVDISWSRL
jgi:hypothetical protein